jgi:adenosylmethionine-8-amino-7-oxononanoate aminotransferase
MPCSLPQVAQLDHAHVWHPFTQMRDWLKREPIVLVGGKGAVLWDIRGRSYLDANSSIWTNLHGHAHPRINAAIERQLRKVAHTSALGFANEPASRLAGELVKVANRGRYTPALTKVFFSDDGSTAIEVALKLAYEYTRRMRGKSPKPRFLALRGAYHGDTVGATSLGQIDLFHKAYRGLLFKSSAVDAPYCYRCPFNRAKPERADARTYRRCNWECTGRFEETLAKATRDKRPFAGFIYEPRLQGAAGMIPQPEGWLRQVAGAARSHGALLIADEVMTGFGRTGAATGPGHAALFAGEHEEVQPDFLCVAKGLTGGYLPMAATLTTDAIFAAFLGEYAEFKAFFHGHSFTGNQLGAAAALASLSLLGSAKDASARLTLERHFRKELSQVWRLPAVGDIRQEGLVAGIELVRDWRTREPFPLAEQAGIRVCEAMARRGVLTRAIGNVIVLMPPYCTTKTQLRRMVAAVADSIGEVHPG